VPLILIPQILFSGLVGVPTGLSKVAGLVMPATWSFDTMKRFTPLDTLKEEGSDPRGKTGGLGYYKFIETENDKTMTEMKRDFLNYRDKTQAKINEWESELRAGRYAPKPNLEDPPKIKDARKIERDLSGYVNFLHPWMNEIVNQLVLMIMFFILVVATLIVLRTQDIG
jgi:hypothetical protein